MANVEGTFYSATTQRRGVTPVSPPNAVDDPVDPVNPPGTGNGTLYKLLGDVTDRDFIGKNGFVPVVNSENVLTLEAIPQITENGLISGGIVQWTGTGYVFNVSGAFYRIGGVAYSTDPTQKTLAAPDPTNNRIDVFAVDTNGIVVVIQGTASPSPVKPQINPSTQLELTSVLVIAASTTPTLTTNVIYDQNVEWTGSSSGTGTANFASTVDPFQGSVSVETTNIQNGFQIQFNNGTPINIANFQTLGFQIKLKSAMPANQNLFITFLDSSANPASRIIALPLDKSVTAYQFVGIVLSSIQFTTNNIQYVRFSFIRTSGSPVYSGYFLDILKLEGGINPPITVGSFTGLSDTPNSYSGQGGKTVAVKSDESGLEFVTGGGGGTFIGLSDTPANYTGSANKFPRVNSVPDALIFDTVSPYDLDQEAASDGQVLTWVAANSRYEPVTPSGGSSNWTVVGSAIYRNSAVAIGRTTIPANNTFSVQSLSSTGTHQFVQFLNNAGTVLAGITENGGFAVNTTPTANVAGLFRAFSDTTGTVSIRAINASNANVFQVTGLDVRSYVRTGINVNPEAGTTLGVQAFASATIAIRVYNNSATRTLDILGSTGAYQSLGGAFFGSSNTGTAPTGRVDIRGIGTTTNATLRLMDSSNVLRFQFLDNGNIILDTTTGTKIGTATGQKLAFWNKTPIIQPTNAITAAEFVANTSGIANDTATYGGYTMGQIAAALINTGILA